jgi:hypothetical protein
VSLHPKICEVDSLPPYGMRVVRQPEPTPVRRFVGAVDLDGRPIPTSPALYKIDVLDTFWLRCPAELRLEGPPIDLDLRAAWDPVDGAE